MSATNGTHPAIQSPRTWFASWKFRSKNVSGNAIDGSSSASMCYMLHAILVAIHVVLVILYISHWEHRMTLPFTPMNNDFWPVILSASLQAFYTIYTVVLLFLTQRLAMSRTLVRRLKLTAIHDISGAWAGLGSALSSVWRQIDISSSWWTISAVTTYLASISVLHITSSTLLQFQTFNTSISIAVPTTLGWSNYFSDGLIQGIVTTGSGSFDYWGSTNWGSIAASLPVVNQLPGLVTAGLSNATLYDIPQTNSLGGRATVNATTITSRCGLLPNITYSVDAGIVTANSSIGNETFLSLTASYPWPDQIQVLQPFVPLPGSNNTTPDTAHGVILMLSTSLSNIQPSIQQEVAVPIPWTIFDSHDTTGIYVVEVYFVQCLLSTVAAEAVLDMQTNSLWNPASMSQPSTQWDVNQWTQWTSGGWQMVISQVLAYPIGSGYYFADLVQGATGNPANEPSIVDEYIMSLVGLNLTAESIQFLGSGRPVSTVVLSPGKLEAAIARAAAQLIWTAGRIGISNGGLQPGNGMANVVEEIISLRLNINLLPLAFAISASVIMMTLALCMTRAFDTSSDNQAAIPDTGALQLMWLGRHSASVNEALEDVEHPTEANLRRAGMIDVCFAKTISDETEELGSSTDSLSFRNGDSGQSLR